MSRAHDIILVQSAVLSELSEQLRDDGMDDVSLLLDRVVERLDGADVAYDRVRSVVSDLEAAYHRLREAALTDAQRDQAAAVQLVLSRLRRAADSELVDTQTIDVGSSRRRPPGES